MAGNALTVDQLRRMMLVFDPDHFTTSYANIATQFTKSFTSELDLPSTSSPKSTAQSTSRPTSPSNAIKSNEHFRFLLASTLITLLNDRFNSQRRIQNQTNLVINHGFFQPLQRLIALYLVYDLYQHKAIGDHAFLPHFMRIIEECPEDRLPVPPDDEKKELDSPQSLQQVIFSDDADANRLSARFAPLCDKIEAEFVIKLLFNRDIAVISQMSCRRFTEVYTEKLLRRQLEPWPEFVQIQQIVSSRQTKNFAYSPLKTLGIHPILRDYDLDLDIKLAPFAVDENVLSDLALAEEFNFGTFDPEMVRPPPPFMLPFGRHELRWQFLGEPPKLLWDDTECKAMERREILDLLKRALKQQLGDEDLQAITEELARQQKSTRSGVLTQIVSADCVHFLVQHNAQLVVPLFLALRPKDMEPYFGGLCSLEVADVEKAQRAFSVMAQLAEQVVIPKKYLHQFISHCIKQCEGTKEPFHQTRLVKHICGFVQNLIAHGALSVKDCAVEIGAFCVEFARIKEATNLYSKLKETDKAKSSKGKGSADHDSKTQ